MHIYYIYCDSCESLCKCLSHPYDFSPHKEAPVSKLLTIPTEIVNDTLVYKVPANRYNQIVDGLCLDVSGGYNEFIDSYDEVLYVNLCHDCSAKFWRTFVHTKNIYNNSGYHYSEEKCCEYSRQ